MQASSESQKIHRVRGERFETLRTDEVVARCKEIEINAVAFVRITVDSGAAKSVWLLRRRGVERTRSKHLVKLAAASGGAIREEGDATLQFV